MAGEYWIKEFYCLSCSFHCQYDTSVSVSTNCIDNMNSSLILFLLQLIHVSLQECIFYSNAMCPLLADNIIGFDNDVPDPLSCQQQ